MENKQKYKISFSGSTTDENGNKTLYENAENIVVGEATPENGRHNIEIINAGE